MLLKMERKGREKLTTDDWVDNTEGEEDMPGFCSEGGAEDAEEAAEEAENLEVNTVIWEAVEHAKRTKQHQLG
jgi:phosphosulfolactate synthase (CoM biosynthesis protein A)